MVTITFENPIYLWFLAALPLLIVTHFFLLRHTKKKALKFANFAVLKRATGSRYITKNYTILFVRLLIIACATLAAAQTVFWYEGMTNENEYVIALDTSASMTAQDLQPSRLAAAKEYAIEFSENLDWTTRLGLVSFSGVTFIEQPLTTDRSAIKKSLEELEIEASGTDISGAIITSTNLLLAADRGRAIILITDGSNTVETFQSQSLQRASQYAKIKRVKVFSIGVGTADRSTIGYLPEYYNVSAHYNSDNLQMIANETGGKYFAAIDEEQLKAAYDNIRSTDTFSTLEFDLTPALMLMTLMLVLVEWGLLNTRFRMLP